jgi:hypothetical protein
MNSVWTGSINPTDWETAGNWSPAQIPGLQTDVVINSPGTPTLLAEEGTANSLTIGSGGSLSIVGEGTLPAGLGLDGANSNSSIAGNITLTAASSAGNATLTLAGTVTLTGSLTLTDSPFNTVQAGNLQVLQNNGTISGAGNLGNGPGFRLSNGLRQTSTRTLFRSTRDPMRERLGIRLLRTRFPTRSSATQVRPTRCWRFSTPTLRSCQQIPRCSRDQA